MTKLKTFILFLLIITSHYSFSQSITNDIGIIAGLTEMRSDYGQRGEAKSNTRNMGFGIAVVHYAGFSYFDNLNKYFKEHIKVRSELSYNKTNMQHYGEWIGKNSLTSKQLQAMRGSTQLFNVGFQIEYSLKHIHDFEREIGSFAPYISLGPQFSYYTAKAWSTMGNIEENVPEKYLDQSDGHPHGFSNESNTVFSIAMNIGTRYKLTPLTDLVLDFRAQYFASDWVDGLNPNKDLFKENKNNDWFTFVGLGYVIYLDN